MLSYTYVTASCPPLRDGIESTSKSILVVPRHALPSLANPREGRVSRASSPYRLARTWAQHPRAQGDPSSSVCVICLEPLGRRADDLQDGVAVHRRGDLSSSERQRPALAWRSRSVGIAMSHRRQQTEARRESVQTSRRRCGLHAVAKTASRVAASAPRASSPVGPILVDHGSVVITEHFVVVEALERGRFPRLQTALQSQKPRCCGASTECRRRDSNPRHADYDSAALTD